MRLLVLVSVLAFVAGPAHADATGDALAEIVKCAGIAEASERLKCFDTVAPRARSALAEEQAKEKRGILDWFGFSRPRKPVTKPEDFGKPQPPLPGGEINEITATVVDFAKTPRGKALFILDNGQVWRQLDGDDVVVHDPPTGKTMKVKIEMGFLENYNLTIEGRNALIRVRRLK